MSGIIEFDDLNDAITQLTGRTFQAYKSQKEFVENASHELQTPLTILQSKLELLMQTSPLNSDQAELISSMADTSQRMNRLNKTLLLLSKIDNQVYAEKELVNMGSVFRDVIRQYEDAIEQKELQVYVDDSSAPSVMGNKTLLEILSSNLVFNAIRHNVTGGYVGVSLTEHEITVENTGAVNPLDTNRLFRRFQKHSSDANSLGLGLEIINKICRINDFKLQYNFIGMKHRFTIILKGDSV
jgi:signal transduction histidine kinase